MQIVCIEYRCIFVNVDPKSGERHPKHEPLKTLNSYRKLLPNEGPWMGVQLALRNSGRISVGDDVFVEDKNDQ